MKKNARMIFGIASLLLVLVYFFPIWDIKLKAPQYPEGLGLNINISSITGHKKNDLNSINNLNHYIGMKKIEPSSINELKIMPFIIGFFIAFGLIIVLLNKRVLIWVWLSLLTIVTIVGLYDFYKWEYEYGHELSPLAIIKIPGQDYQPPFLGTQQLLNFTATSLPHISAYVLTLSVILAILAIVIDKKEKI
jgi:copper chaperone NosL